MNAERFATHGFVKLALALMMVQPVVAMAQVPVDDNGKVIGAYDPVIDATNENLETDTDIPLMSDLDLEELVGPVALYPDDLLAIILPAAAYPLQIVGAARFLEDLETNPSLKPDPDWDDSVVALLNYPEVVKLMSDDIDWTWRLGEAVIAQQGDVVLAVESFRDLAYDAGNLKSDEYQNVSREEGYIEITPVEDDVIYVPYYEPERVVVYQPQPVYSYYPRSYPVYNYPYSSAYSFNSGYFWGVTTAFSIGWFTDSLHVHHHSYRGHPYYGRSYRDHYWYRRPTMHSYRNTYGGYSAATVSRYRSGDNWRPRRDRSSYISRDVRAANNRYVEQRTTARRDSERRRNLSQITQTQTARRQEPIAFRERSTENRSRAQEQRVDMRSTARELRSNGPARQNNEYVAQRRESRNDVVPQMTQRRQQPVAQREQRRQQPVAQRQQRREAPPQARQQRSSPPPQQQQQRSSPPKQQQRSEPPAKERSEPQRQARAESGSSTDRSSRSQRKRH